jgi:NDP-sugar pyrophosphorylase family protein
MFSYLEYTDSPSGAPSRRSADTALCIERVTYQYRHQAARSTMMIARIVSTAAIALFLVSTVISVSAADANHSAVLGSVDVAPGEHVGEATTVNGSVEIGANAVVQHAKTVNGSVTIHEHANVGSVETVNGSTEIGAGARVTGNVELVNGDITLASRSDVTGHLTNVNGSIVLTAAHVGGGIQTRNSDLTIGADSRVEGGIFYEKPERSWFSFSTVRLPRIVIGPGAIVKGPIRFQREVKLYVSDHATIGPVEGATVNKFSGSRP